MTAQETKLFNAYESTLTSTVGASGLDFVVNSVTAPTAVTLAAPFYIVLNPDSSTNREVILVTSVNTGTKTLTCDNINKRFLDGSAASSGLSHASGSVVRMSPVEQHIEDLNDRVDTIINEAGTAVNTSLFLDEDDMSTDSATKGVTQQSVKAYVDAQVTAQDLDLISDSGTIDIDLDSDSLTVAGGEGIDTSATGTTLTIAGEEATTSNKGVASFSSDNFAVSSGAVTIKTGGVDNDELAGSITNAKLSNSTVSYGGVSLALGASDATPAFDLTDATNYPTSSLSGTITNAQLAGSIANAKLSNSSITVSDGSSSTAISLGGTITFSGTSNEVEIAESSGTLTIGLPATITANVTGNVSGTSGSTTGNAATATALATARNIGGVSFDGTGNIDLPGVNSAGNQNTSGTAADLSATLDETKGGTGLTSFTTGDVVYASGSNTLAKLGIGSSGEVLSVSSGGIVEWAAATTGDITQVTAGTGLSGGGASGDVSLAVETSQNITALTGGDLTIYEDANNADVSIKMGTSAAESLTIEVLNGGSNKTAEQINFTTATASGTANHGKMVFNVDATEIATVDDDGINLASGKTFRINGTAVGDITGVTAGTNLGGGGASGSPTLNLAIDSEVAFADQVASAVILKDYSETEQAVSSAAALAINLANGNTGTVTLAHNVTDIDFTNVPTDIATFTLVVTQDGTGSRTMAINAITVNADSHQTAKTAGGAGLTLSTAAAAIDILTFMFVDETPYLFSQLAFA